MSHADLAFHRPQLVKRRNLEIQMSYVKATHARVRNFEVQVKSTVTAMRAATPYLKPVLAVTVLDVLLLPMA